METQKSTNKTTLMGDLEVKGMSTINGDLVVKGNIISSDQQKKYDNVVYLGDPMMNGSWRLRSDDNEMMVIERFVDGFWIVKQSIS
jgi:hypothetical protein